MPAKRPGRPRTFDWKKRKQVIELVARAAKLGDAAAAVGVSIRTIQRDCRLDSDYNEELRSAQAVKADPRELMQSAARTHWRAAAWLLEREDPEHYGRRPASSCSPRQFDKALRAIMEAALRFAPPEVRAELHDHLEVACEQVFQAVFPLLYACGNRREPQLPPTPLAEQEKLLQLSQGRRARHVYDDDEETGEKIIPQLVANGPASVAPVGVLAYRGRLGDKRLPHQASAASCRSAPVDESLRDSRSMATPTTPGDRHAPRDERLPWQYAQRVVRTTSAILPCLDDEQESVVLSPKTHSATERNGDNSCLAVVPHVASAYGRSESPIPEG